MSKSILKAVQLILVGTLIFLTGCNAQPTQPTLDPNMIYTAAAQTVQAQLVVASAGTATAQAVPPTATVAEATAAPTLLATAPANPSPTFTLGATLSINLPGVTTTVPGNTTATAPADTGATPVISIATLVPTTAPGAPVPTGDKAKYIDQNPDDNTPMTMNNDFDETWKIQNVGTTTWDTTNYYYADMTASDQLAKHTWYFLKSSVAPNQVAFLVVDMKTPGTAGTYKSSWCLINKANPTRCIAIFDVTINVH